MSATPLPAQHLRGLAEELIDPAVGEPFGLYAVTAQDPAAEIAAHVEQAVFAEAFGNSPLLLNDEYGRYERSSVFLCVVDHRRRLPAGMMRILLPSPAGFKSVDDLDRFWGQDPGTIVLPGRMPMDLAKTWDIATLAVVPDYRRGATSGLVTLALSQAVFMGAAACGVEWLVAILDIPVLRRLQWQLRSPLTSFDGLTPRPYLGSAASLPVFSDLVRWKAHLARTDEAMFQTLFHGQGLEGAVAPWSVEGLVDTVASSPAFTE